MGVLIRRIKCVDLRCSYWLEGFVEVIEKCNKHVHSEESGDNGVQGAVKFIHFGKC